MTRIPRTARLLALTGMAAGLIAAPAALADTARVDCDGTDRACAAHVPLAGGASNREVTVELTGTNERLRSSIPIPAQVKGAFSASPGRYQLGGSEYVFTLNAVGSIGKGAYAGMFFTTSSRTGPKRIAVCGGSEDVCTAMIPLKGGASNLRIKVQLPGTNLKRVATTAMPGSAKKAYSLTNGRYTTGGSVYEATLNAVKSNGANNWLAVTFLAPAS